MMTKHVQMQQEVMSMNRFLLPPCREFSLQIECPLSVLIGQSPLSMLFDESAAKFSITTQNGSTMDLKGRHYRE